MNHQTNDNAPEIPTIVWARGKTPIGLTQDAGNAGNLPAAARDGGAPRLRKSYPNEYTLWHTDKPLRITNKRLASFNLVRKPYTTWRIAVKVLSTSEAHRSASMPICPIR